MTCIINCLQGFVHLRGIMTAQQKLVAVKCLHTAVWAGFVALICYVVWCGFTGHITPYSWWAAGAVVGEGIVLALFKGSCPLTVVARRYSASAAHNFDIYLPEWLAKYNKLIFTSIYCIGLGLMLVRTFL